jgi:hypothetical protein
MTKTPLNDLLDPTPDGPDGTSRPAENDNGFDDEFGAPSGRRRLSVFSTILVTGIVIALSFTGGVLVQKRATSSSSSTAGGLPNFGGGGGFPSGLPVGGGGAGAGTRTSPGSTGSGSTSTVPVLVGTVVKASATEVTVKDLGGTTHVVRTTDATKVTTVTTVPITKLTAGQSVTVNGTKTSDGSIDATAVSAR